MFSFKSRDVSQLLQQSQKESFGLTLSTRQRLCLAFAGHEPLETALARDDAELSGNLLLENGISLQQFIAAELTALDVHGLQVTLEQLQRLGLDGVGAAAAGPAFCKMLSEAFGRRAAATSALVTPIDAIALAGEPSVCAELGIDADDLIAACRDAPIEAEAVLRLLGVGAIDELRLDTLPASKIDAEGLRRAKIPLNNLLQRGWAGAISHLGYKL